MRRFAAALATLVAAACAGSILAGGEVYGTVRTTGGEILDGPIRWAGEERFWDQAVGVFRAVPPETSDSEGGFRLSLFGWNLIPSGDSSGNRGRRVAAPFGHLRSIEAGAAGRAVLELKGGSRIDAETSPRDLALIVVDPEKGEVEVPWRRVERIEFAQGPGEGDDGDRLYGTVDTSAGTFRGFVVWDRDESVVADVLDGEERGVERKIRFAEIASIEPHGSSAAVVTLKSGKRVELRGTNDVNADNRGVLVTQSGLGMIAIDWEHLDKVTFAEPPPSARYADFDGGRRLSGTVHKTDGSTLAGEITWDMDETHSWEALDGESEGLDYAVSFRFVRSIRPRPGSAEVRLRNDRLLVLSGTNDVNQENRGVAVSGTDGAEHVLAWEEIELVEFD